MTRARPSRVTADIPVVSTLADAFRRGWKDGRTEIGTDYVLAELLRRIWLPNRELRRAKSRFTSAVRQRAEEIGERQAPVAAFAVHEFEAAAILREAVWMARRKMRLPFDHDAPNWTEDSHAALRRALADGQDRDLSPINKTHLLVAVLKDWGNRANDVLSELGIGSLSFLEGAPVGTRLGQAGETAGGIADVLLVLGAVEGAGPRKARLSRLLGRLLTLGKRLPEGPVLRVVRQEATRQAVRLDGEQVGQAHLLVAICALDAEMNRTGYTFTSEMAAANQAAEVLARCGVDYQSLVLTATTHGVEAAPPDTNPPWRTHTGDPPVGRDLTACLAEARSDARQGADNRPGSSHVLWRMLSDGSGSAVRLLRQQGVDVAKLRAELAGVL